MVPNPKVLSVDPPMFASFPGWSILFDNPGNAIREVEWGGQFLDTDPGSRGNELYAAFWRALEKIRISEMCPLPATTAHTTFQDGINADSMPASIEAWPAYEEFFRGLPHSVSGPLPPGLAETQSRIARMRQWGVRLRFKNLEIFERSAALVGTLEPADGESAIVLEQLRDVRRQLDLEQFVLIGKPLNRELTPHVSFAYLVSQDAAKAARADLAAWNDIFLKETAGLTIEYASMGVYVFEDMGKFWRVPVAHTSLVIEHETLEQAIQSRTGRLGKEGEQKVCVPELWPKEELIEGNRWRLVSKLGKRPVLRTRGVELAVFTQLAGQDRHYHRAAVEVYTCLRGEMSVYVAGQIYPLVQGDTIIVNPWAVHEVLQRGEFLAQVLTVKCGGVQDKFFV
jgi:quercetin dioxygenase-like cupin family protein